MAPKFSHDKKLLIYENKYYGTDHDNGLMLLDIASGIATRILHDKDSRYNMFGNRVIWKPSDSSIYFSQTVFTGGSTEDILTYDFVNKNSRRLTDTFEYSEWPVGFKGQDSLIIFSNDTVSTNQPPGLYYMNLDGSYLRRINNPHFESILGNPDWCAELGLIVFSQKDTTYTGLKIAITNLDGTYYKTYTSGDFGDYGPVWGPDNKVVLFGRVNIPTGNPRVMLLDIEGGKVTQFVPPIRINGATELFEPDY